MGVCEYFQRTVLYVIVKLTTGFLFNARRLYNLVPKKTREIEDTVMFKKQIKKFVKTMPQNS